MKLPCPEAPTRFGRHPAAVEAGPAARSAAASPPLAGVEAAAAATTAASSGSGLRPRCWPGSSAAAAANAAVAVVELLPWVVGECTEEIR